MRRFRDDLREQFVRIREMSFREVTWKRNIATEGKNRVAKGKVEVTKRKLK
jgi:hypothetical protein